MTNIYLTYNTFNGDLHKGISLEHKGLSAEQIQIAIDQYILNQQELIVENKRLNKLLDNVLNENKNYKRVMDLYQERWAVD